MVGKHYVSVLAALALSATLLSAHAAEKEGAASAPVEMKFTTNLASGASGSAMVQVNIVLEGESPEVNHEVEIYQPKIRHEVILLLSSLEAAVLSTREGKGELAEKIRSLANRILGYKKGGIQEVLYTAFVIQR